jgi:arylsulfatase A-like enzyme
MDGEAEDCTRRWFLGGSVAGAVAGMVGCGGDHVASALGDTSSDSSSTGHAIEETGDAPARDDESHDDGSGSTGEPSRPVHARRPNIIFITLDDAGWTLLPSYGNPHIHTPAFASLADDGIVFTNAFLVTSSCSPSRGTYLTGQYPHTNGLVGLVHRYPEQAIPTDYPTLPRMLGDIGYACAHQGKWHVSDKNAKKFGFDESLNDITGTKKIRSADEAIDFMRRHRTMSFYLQLDFVETHAPWVEHEGLPVDPDGVHVLDDWMMPDWPELRRLAAAYFGEVRHVDAVLANVLQALDELGLAEDTFIVVTSDNGAPFPGNKGTLYDRGIRTPLVVRWPAGAAAGERSQAYVSAVDVPAAMSIVGMARMGPGMQGSSGLYDLLENPHRSYRDRIYTEMTYHAHYCPARALRTDRWKYIRNLSPDPWGVGSFDDEEWAYALLELPGHDWLDERPRVELYDLEADPHEVVNLADAPEYATVRADMHAALLAEAAAVGDHAFDLDV